jgi:hypothetical protein
LGFVKSLVHKTVDLPYRNQKLGWQGSFSNKLRGVRVWLYGFACTGHQSEPLSFIIGEKLDSQAAFEAAIQSAMDNMIPDGGTCPGEAIDKTVAKIQGNDLLTRLYKTAILFTDGVFYDMPRPKRAAMGFPHFGVLTYAMGIAIPINGNQYGLTPEEIKRQRSQLLGFVGGEEDRMFNFGLEGITLLDEISTEFVDQLPRDAVDNLPNLQNRPFWCGYTSEKRCTNTNPESTNTGQYCKWSRSSRSCLPKGWCKYAKPKCVDDPYCEWKAGKCAAKPPYATIVYP